MRIEVQGSSEDYGSISTFTNDLDFLFANPSDNGGFYYDRTFKYTVPSEGDGYGSSSKYNYLIESYESTIQNVSEKILPNHYNINLLERVGDTATLTYDLSTASGIPPVIVSVNVGLPGALDVYDATVNHTLLTTDPLSPSLPRELLRAQGLYSDNYFESEYALSGLSFLEYLESDLSKTLDIKYSDYYSAWPSAYIDLESSEVDQIQELGTNIIFSAEGYSLLNSLSETENKLPFYSTVAFIAESPPVYDSFSSDILLGSSVTPIADELANSLLFPTLGSHIAGVYEPGYIDPRASTGENQYSFSGKTFIDSDSGQQQSLMVSPPLNTYLDGGAVRGGQYAYLGSFHAALRYNEGVAGDFYTGTPPELPRYSPQDSFSLDKKTFIDVKSSIFGDQGKTDLAIALSKDPFIDSPDASESLLISDFIFDVTQMSTLFPGSISSTYGAGGLGGLTNQINRSFSTTKGTVEGSVLGRLYQESFEDGELSLNETVMYRIKKYKGSNTNVEPIQNIWLQTWKNLTFIQNTLTHRLNMAKNTPMRQLPLSMFFGMKYKYVGFQSPSRQL